MNRVGALKAVLGKLAGRRVLVVGDVMLDRYLFGMVERISPEAPVPVVEVVRETEVLGGAANVAANMASLGGRVSLVGLIGADAAGKSVGRALRALQVSTQGLVVDSGRPTTLKTRVLGGHQHIVRVDREQRGAGGPRVQARLAAVLAALAPGVDAILVSDYAKGVVQPELLDRVRDRARHGLVVVVDPKRLPFSSYRGLTLATPNLAEASLAAGTRLKGDAEVAAAGRRLRREHDLEHLLITRGSEGMTLVSKGRVVHIPAVAREVFDVSGAGDTVAAVMALGLAAGAPVEAVARVANAAAAVVVARLGTAVVDPASLRQQIESLGRSPGRGR